MKTKAQVSMKLISTFVFALRIVLFLYFLNPKFLASSHLMCLYSSVCARPVQKPHCWFSKEVAYFFHKDLVMKTFLVDSRKALSVSTGYLPIGCLPTNSVGRITDSS